MSAKAWRHIPPKIVLNINSDYALFENIYHEALHQQLSTTLLFCESIDSEFSSTNCGKIPVPWRGSAWEPDRVLHATFVYSRLLSLRKEAEAAGIQLASNQSFQYAVNEAINALTYLTGQFHLVRPAFTEKGQGIVDEVLASAIAEIASSAKTHANCRSV